MVKLDITGTLKLEIVTGADPHVAVIRKGGGLVRVEPHELRALVAGLVESACRLADAAIEVRR